MNNIVDIGLLALLEIVWRRCTDEVGKF